MLVLNSGSSSVKYQLLDMADGRRLAGGLAERIGESGGGGRIVHTSGDGGRRERTLPFPDHAAALGAVGEELRADGLGLDSPGLAAVGHRVVHGGTRFTEPTLVTDEVLEEVRALTPLAPLHNPANVTGIETARALRPDLPQVAVFDTAFHATLPEAAARYAVDRAVADRFSVRRYGFHGTSHQYVSRAAAGLLGREPSEVNVIVLHLGNGASASAVAGGVCVETSMGMTPLEGLVMGTRSGDLDPAVVFHLSRVGGLTMDEVDDLLNRRSGLVGLCGDNDMREIVRRREEGDREAAVAFDVYVHRLRKYIGAYTAVLGRVDALVFTAGVGENSAPVRAAATAGLEGLGITVDPELNAGRGGGARLVSPPGARVPVAVVPTDEEFEIARQAFALVGRSPR
ncbi:acetate kinase [Streptacidiphilus sp. ASG 303]|uniref:acetate kinase n=1 Tax=Streptacidiphilus sp. ASG 303 TaxID=2896847 RepID=UPI001E340B8E|nr:acetate kinase [Streptacidiphilus sp. ASG 303]MCD0482997.1 acetate kinase [Streptacidiphilus sp. ASG 303]